MKYLEKFYKWAHVKSKVFAIVWLFLPAVAMLIERVLGIESIFLPAMGFVVLLGLFFLWGDRRWWDDIKDLYD